MKPKLTLMLATLLSSALLFVACSSTPPPADPDRSFLVTAQMASGYQFLGQVLDDLAAESDLHLVTSGDTARFVQEIGTVIPKTSANEFVALYASTDDERYVWLESFVDVDDVRFYSTTKGIDDMPILDGVDYLFTISTF